jgi:flagellar hook-associated protein 1 FlgK
MAAGFSSQGLTLFTDASGAVPGVGTVGFSSTIQVSTAVQATPSMVRDGATPSGAAGDTTLINKVLDGVFASGATTLSGQAAALVAGHAQLAAASASRADTDKAVRQGLESKLSSSTGVSVDTEMTDMIRLQSAYAANAKVIAAVQDMWTQLLGTVR